MTAIFMLVRPVTASIMDTCNMGYEHLTYKRETMWVVVEGDFDDLTLAEKKLTKYIKEGWQRSFGTVHGVTVS